MASIAGNWQVSRYKNKLLVRDYDDNIICEINQFMPACNELAALIKASPGLLAACKSLVQGLDSNDDPEWLGLTQQEWDARVTEARAAIAEAEPNNSKLSQ